MKISYDEIADAMYIKYSDNKISNTKDLNWSIVDFDENWNIVWIEIIWVKKHFKDNNIILKSIDKEELIYS